MKTICLYFEIHQIIHLKRYRFFDIGTDHYYYDDYANETSIGNITENSYIPALKTLIAMAKESDGAFKVALSLSGVGLEQLERYAPQVIDLLQELAGTGCCEFIAEPYSHGLASLAPNGEASFRDEVKRQVDKINQLFGQKPKVFRNSSLIYDDEIGGLVADMGFKGILPLLPYDPSSVMMMVSSAYLLTSSSRMMSSLVRPARTAITRLPASLRALMMGSMGAVPTPPPAQSTVPNFSM